MEGLTSAGTSFVSSSTHRWIYDLQACQTEGSAKRGVGRYSQALFDAMRKRNAAVDICAATSDALPHGPDLSGLRRDRRIRIGPMPQALGQRKHLGGPQDDLDAILLSHRLAPWKADLVHVSHVFEGFNERVALPSPAYRSAGQVLSATLYDLIPLRFPEAYFQSPEFERWYHARLDWLRKADLLLAISESSRRDAIDLLGIDPDRIVTVYGGIGQHFTPPCDRQQVKAEL